MTIGKSIDAIPFSVRGCPRSLLAQDNRGGGRSIRVQVQSGFNDFKIVPALEAWVGERRGFVQLSWKVLLMFAGELDQRSGPLPALPYFSKGFFLRSN